jgi:hypothetical protein
MANAAGASKVAKITKVRGKFYATDAVTGQPCMGYPRGYRTRYVLWSKLSAEGWRVLR